MGRSIPHAPHTLRFGVARPNRIRLWLGFVLFMGYNNRMFRTKLVTLGNSPTQITFTDEVDSHYTIVITNTSSNKHALIGTSSVSTTNYGIRVEHDGPPVILENMYFKDRLFGISEDEHTTVQVAIMVIERN